MHSSLRRRWIAPLVLLVLGGAMIVGPMVVPVTGQVPTLQPTTTTEEPTTTTARRTSTTTTTQATTTSTTATSSTERPTTSSTAATTTSTTAAGGATTTVAGSSTTLQQAQVDPITNRPLVPSTTVPVGLDVGNPARISPIFPWLSALGFLAALGIMATQYFLTGRRS